MGKESNETTKRHKCTCVSVQMPARKTVFCNIDATNIASGMLGACTFNKQFNKQFDKPINMNIIVYIYIYIYIYGIFLFIFLIFAWHFSKKTKKTLTEK